MTADMSWNAEDRILTRMTDGLVDESKANRFKEALQEIADEYGLRAELLHQYGAADVARSARERLGPDARAGRGSGRSYARVRECLKLALLEGVDILHLSISQREVERHYVEAMNIAGDLSADVRLRKQFRTIEIGAGRVKLLSIGQDPKGALAGMRSFVVFDHAVLETHIADRKSHQIVEWIVGAEHMNQLMRVRRAERKMREDAWRHDAGAPDPLKAPVELSIEDPMPPVRDEVVCRGSWALGNNCKTCRKCRETRPLP